eukprot:1246762-Amphidinium_carterae.1
MASSDGHEASERFNKGAQQSAPYASLSKNDRTCSPREHKQEVERLQVLEQEHKVKNRSQFALTSLPFVNYLCCLSGSWWFECTWPFAPSVA